MLFSKPTFPASSLINKPLFLTAALIPNVSLNGQVWDYLEKTFIDLHTSSVTPILDFLNDLAPSSISLSNGITEMCMYVLI